jgi:nicotinamidase-related amidase
MNADTALLMLDYQVALCEEGPLCRAAPLAAAVREKGVVATARRVLMAARGRGIAVFHVRLAFDPTFVLRTNRLARFDTYVDDKAMIVGSPEAQFVADLAPSGGEPVVDKGCVDPFVGTPLRVALAAERVTHVVLGGVATNLVVESAARHASDIGLQVSVVEDMCASFSAAAHDFAMSTTLPLFGTVTSADSIVRSWS